jgi:hypothetical protein
LKYWVEDMNGFQTPHAKHLPERRVRSAAITPTLVVGVNVAATADLHGQREERRRWRIEDERWNGPRSPKIVHALFLKVDNIYAMKYGSQNLGVRMGKSYHEDTKAQSWAIKPEVFGGTPKTAGRRPALPNPNGEMAFKNIKITKRTPTISDFRYTIYEPVAASHRHPRSGFPRQKEGTIKHAILRNEAKLREGLFFIQVAVRQAIVRDFWPYFRRAILKNEANLSNYDLTDKGRCARQFFYHLPS